jgi:pimeloyl-ACP methyl ester carboxylesterase
MSIGEIRSRWVRANGVKTCYAEVGGDGPTIVALHGGGHGSSGRSGMGPIMARLADEFRVVAPDSIGGYGGTDVSAPTPHGLLNRVDHTSDFVDALCLDRFTIMGNSQGAWAAAHYATLNPDRVEKIVLVSSLTIAQAMGIQQAPTDAMKALQGYDGTPEAMRRLLEGLIADPSKITDELIERRQASASRPGAMEAMRAFVKTTGALRSDPVLSLHMDMRATLPALTAQIPTIFIWGEEDSFALPASGRDLAPLLPDVKFHWIAGASHQVQTDKPEEVAGVIAEFLRA